MIYIRGFVFRSSQRLVFVAEEWEEMDYANEDGVTENGNGEIGIEEMRLPGPEEGYAVWRPEDLE